MKRLIVTILAMLTICVDIIAQDISSSRVTFGAEWGYIGVFYSGYHYNFYAPEGYRVDPRGYRFMYDSNAEAYFHVGYNIGKSYNISLYCGVSAIEDYHHTLPVSLRLTRYFGDRNNMDKWLSFIDIGSGISLKANPREILTGKVGIGYRISLSRTTKLDFILALRSVLTHPDIYYYGNEIVTERINRNNAYNSASSIGISLTF